MKVFARRKTEPCCKGDCSAETMKRAEQEKADDKCIKILGSGCPKCNALEAATKDALTKLNMNDTVEHVTDFTKIAAFGVMSTPALVIDGRVVSYGKVLKSAEVETILKKVRG